MAADSTAHLLPLAGYDVQGTDKTRDASGPSLSWAARPAAYDYALTGESTVKVAPCVNVGYDHEKISYPFASLEGAMRTVQMTLDDVLVQEIDQVVKELGTTRSAFAREAFRAAIAQVRRQAMERMHREGYARRPVQPGEFSDWEDEQVWVE